MAKHRRSTSTGRSIARLAMAGAVIAAPLALAVPAQAAPNWDTLAQCESGGRWNINTGNGYSGGLQFAPSTWRAYGGTQYAANAHQASREQQIAVAQKVLAGQGPGAWPACTKKTGWNNGAGASAQKPAAAAPAKKAAPQTKAAQKAAPQKAAKKAVPQTKAAKKAAPQRAAAPKNGADYTVKAGDTLSKIAAAQGVRGGWQAVFERNRDVISNANLIFPGQQIDLR